MTEHLDDPDLITKAQLARMVGDKNPTTWARRHGVEPVRRVKVEGAPGSPAALYSARAVTDAMLEAQTRPRRRPLRAADP